jgi:hypothetical protein
MASVTFAGLPLHTASADSQALALRRRTFLKRGPAQQVGNGVARAYVLTDRIGNPLEVGIEFSQKALTGLPEEGFGTEYTLALPKQASLLPFDHVTMDWNPHGHPPLESYGEPHFDFHFYMMSQAERNQILPTDPLGDLQPAPEFLPSLYFNTHSVVPRMGVHWLDLTSPELNGGDFNTTFIYGYFKGEMNFLEPMVSLAFLQSKTNITLPIRQPEKFGKAGYYPSQYSVRYDRSHRRYYIALGGLMFKQATSSD